MLLLRLFGGLTLSSPDGPIAGRAGQRRRLALLAILAHARGRPVSRDKVIALLWPEADTERARRLLTDSIYVLRDELGDDVLVTRGDDIAPNAERISSDVEAFLRDLEAGDRAAAVERYARGGLFLDGVHLREAPEFERWVDSVRTQLQEAYRRAVEELAKEAAACGDHGQAIARWRQLALDNPLSSRVALALMRALADAGDMAGAIEIARTHERIVRVELESAPDPAVTAFADELRARAGAAQPTVREAAAEDESAQPKAIGATPAVPPASAPRPALAYGVAALVFVGSLLGAWLLWHGRLGSGPRAAAPRPSIVVLPLTTLGADPGDAALADGMTEEFIAILSKVTGLRVIASTSAFAFKGRPLDVRLIADSLRVSYILEGDVQRTGGRLRVRVRLVDARDGTTRWSEVYDREMKDVFVVQDNIARAVARELSVRLGGEVPANVLRHQTRSIVAYEWYLRGNDPLLFRSDSGLYQSLDYFTLAIEADSTYAAAYAGLAYRYVVLGNSGGQKLPARDLFARAERAASKAVALDDSLGEAHTALGFARMFLLDLASAERELERALTLDPRGELTQQIVIYWYSWTARPAGALVLARRGLNDDPLSAVAIAELAHAYLLNRSYDSALAQLGRIAALHPPLRRAVTYATICYINKGMWREAIAQQRLAPGGGQIGRALLAYALARAGQRAEANQILGALIARWQRSGDDAFWVAMVYAGLGDLDRTFTWLDRSVDDLSFRPNLVDTVLHEVAADPRYQRIRQRVGLQNR